MKKIICVLFLVVSFLLILSINVSADNSEQQFEDEYLNEADDYLSRGLDNEINDYLDENEISLKEPSSMTNISIESVFKGIIDMFISTLKAPIKLLGYLIGIMVLCAMIQALSDTEDKYSLSKILDIVGVLISISVIFKYISASIELMVQAITDGANFMTVYVPIYASVIAASGSLTSAGVYNIAVMLICKVVIQLSTTVLIPLLSIYLALTIIQSVNPALNFAGFTSGVKTFVQWSIGLIMTVFVGMITIQSIVGVSADSVGIRTTKFVVSSFIPVVGGAISEAYTTIKGSLGLIRSSVGTFGIIILLLTIIPPLLSIVSIKITVSLAGFVGEILGVEKISRLLKNVSSVLSIAISILASFALMMIIATTVLMMVSLNLV